MHELPSADAAARLAVALAVGLLIGLERGWRDRELPEGGRVAGLRTFALIGLLGGLLTLWSDSLLLPATGLASVALLFGFSYARASAAAKTLSITTAVAALVTFGLGALAARGHAIIAMGSAVVVALLLDLKGPLHRGLRLIEPAELNALLQLGLLSAVILPLLPNQGYGPYEALNPFNMWLAVVLIAALSLAGHAAARFRGPRQGLLWTGLLGSLASSTAATLSLARAARDRSALAAPAAAGVVGGCGVMFVRMAAVVTLLQPRLAWPLGTLLLVPALACFVAAACQWRRPQREPAHAPVDPDGRVFDLPAALAFGVVLGAVALLARAAQAGLGAAGLYTVALVSGFADVDAILVSTVQMFTQGQLSADVLVRAALIAAGGNMVTKAALAWGIGGRALGWRVACGYAFAAAAGGAIIWASETLSS